jgi:hypothetical protein
MSTTATTASMTGLLKPETQRQRGSNAIFNHSQRANNIDNSMENGTSLLFVSSFHEEKNVKSQQQTYEKRILWIRRILVTVLFLLILEYGSIWMFGNFW